MRSPRKNQGVALVTALLIVSLATVAAVSFATQQQLDIRRTGNLINGDQAWAYAEGAEGWAKLILQRDQKKNAVTDDLTEPWAQPLKPIDLPGGYMIATISDAQARLNLNNLVLGSPDAAGDAGDAADDLTGNAGIPPGIPGATGSVDTETQNRLRSLLAQLQLDPNLVTAIVDWMDRDINARPPNGAEDDYYSNLEHPYRTANQPMVSVSELRLVKGFTEKAYQRIAPFVTALPTSTTINVNTAPAHVLAIVLGIDPESAVALVQLRQKNPFKDPTEFASGVQTIAGIQLSETQLAGIGVTSQYFNVNAETRIGYGRAALTSLLFREGQQGDIKVLQRAQGLL